MYKKIITFILTLISVPTFADLTSNLLFSRQEINTMHSYGIKMALEGEREPYIIPVDISQAQLVKTETLSFANLDLHVIHPWLGRFTKLRHLDLSGTYVLAEQFAVLKNLQALEHLDLTGVKLFGHDGHSALNVLWNNSVLDALWSKLTNLRILKLGDTAGENSSQWWYNYNSKHYGNIGQLSNLIYLDLSGNQLADIAALKLERLNLLRTLNLSGNRFANLDLRQLPPNLNELNISNSRLTAFTWSAGLDFPQLGLLKLDNNPGLKIAPEWGDVFLMQQLASLDIDSNVSVPNGWRDKLKKIHAQEQALLEKIRTQETARKEQARLEKIRDQEEVNKQNPHEIVIQPSIIEKQTNIDSTVEEILIDDRYKDHKNGTVTDIQTGLMWKRCSERQIWQGDTCIGEPNVITWRNAMLQENQKNWPKFAEYDDWRIPTMKELKTLIWCSNGTPLNEAWIYSCAGKKDRYGKDYQSPTININSFPNTPSELFWSLPIKGKKCYLNFKHGGGWCSNSISANCHIRLVRGGKKYLVLE